MKDSRLFKKSNYEKEFGKTESLSIFNYKGYDIYSYLTLFDEVRYAFWYSSEDSEYLSSIETTDDCTKLIDNILESNK